MNQHHPGTHSELDAGITRLFRRYSAGLMGAGLCVALLCPSTLALGKEPATEAKKSADLTEEDKEIIKDLDLLENLTLLQDLDSIDFLDILNGMNPDWAEEAETADQADKKEGGVK